MAERSNTAQDFSTESLQSALLSAVFDQERLIVVTDLTGQILYVSPALARLLKTDTSHLNVPQFSANFPEDARRAMSSMTSMLRQTGQLAATIDLGRQGQFSVSVSTLSDALALWQFERVEPAMAIAVPEVEWQAMLSATALAIHGLQSVDATADAIVVAAVPQVGDWCTIDLLDSRDLFLRRAAVWHADSGKAMQVRKMRRRYPVTRAAHHPVMGVVTGGDAVLIEAFTDDRVRRMTRDDDHYRFISSLGIRSSMILPLQVNGTILGAITFSTAESNRTYCQADLARAKEFARHAALAIHSTQRFQYANEVSRIREHYLSVASHEIRTPLAVISGFASLLGRQFDLGTPDPDRSKVLLAELRLGVERLESLTEDLLVVSSVQQVTDNLNLEECDLVELANEVIQRHLVANPDFEGNIHLDGDASVIGRCEPGLIDRALSNLIGNAVKYSTDEVDVRVTVTTDDSGNATVRIADAGIGMSSGDLETLFMPFVRGSMARRVSEGTGLGLYITNQIVSQHGGSIDVESVEGRGTTFTVMLPLQTHRS